MFRGGRGAARGGTRLSAPSPAVVRPTAPKAPLARPEPDYEVVEFPTDQYVNAKLHPPPTPPRPPGGIIGNESCGLCGGGGARVHCSECGSRALCASCDEMYHRHPKRRHHLRQALKGSPNQQVRDVRPPLPPKSTPPVPPPRRHKISGDRMSASPRPVGIEQRRATVGPGVQSPIRLQHDSFRTGLQTPITRLPPQLGSMPYLVAPPSRVAPQFAHPAQNNMTLAHPPNWNRTRATFAQPQYPQEGWSQEPWEIEQGGHLNQGWGMPALRKGVSVLELGGGDCTACVNPNVMPGWRYGSCASLDHHQHPVQFTNGSWAPCCQGQHSHLPPRHMTPQPYRRAESRTVSRPCSRPASPAMSVRSRASRRAKPRTPSPSLPSSDADSESDGDEIDEKFQQQEQKKKPMPQIIDIDKEEDSLGPPPPAPQAPWQCEHCTFVNEAGLRVCSVCCRTPTSTAKLVNVTSKEPANPLLQITNKSKQVDQARKQRVSTASGQSPPPQNKINNHKLPNLNKTNVDNGKIIPQNISIEPIIQKEQVDRIESQTSPVQLLNSKTKFNDNYTRNVNITTGNSPPREYKSSHSVSVDSSPPRETSNNTYPKTIIGNKIIASTPIHPSTSTTGTSPPPQSISTQTYEVPNTWNREKERALSVTRSRSRRRYRDRDDLRRERSHSRVSLSSDTRESERSAHTSGGRGTDGRWEWRETRDDSPVSGGGKRSSRNGEWSPTRTPHLVRRASHMDLHRSRPVRRTSLYGSEAPSPEPLSNARAISMEVLAGGTNGSFARRETERGLQLARLLAEAERAGYSAAEVHAALAQCPTAPLAWLRERWPQLCAGVRAAAARLAPGVQISESEARSALAKHRASLWPAVSECIERYRRQAEELSAGEEGRVRGHVWGSPVEQDVEASPLKYRTLSPHRSFRTRDDSSDEYEETGISKPIQDWLFTPLGNDEKELSNDFLDNKTSNESNLKPFYSHNDMQSTLSSLLQDETLLPNTNETFFEDILNLDAITNIDETYRNNKSLDFIHIENDFINAYNAATSLSPLPVVPMSSDLSIKTETYLSNNKKESDLNEPLNINDTYLNIGIITGYNGDPPTTNIVIDTGKSEQSEQSNKIDSVNSETNSAKLLNQHFSDNAIDVKTPTSNENNLVKKNEKNYIVNEDHGKANTNNLNDIVDNTQKIIQQMKNEINSDINNLDDHRSYGSDYDSNSENSTDDVSSYDSEAQDTSFKDDTSTSSYEVEDKVLNVRTSSEDNDQFEEAIDHMNQDDNLIDIKQSNIEILDSIVKNLQEQHIISVLPAQKATESLPHQDKNNNYTEVKSFDEIYDQINIPQEMNDKKGQIDEMPKKEDSQEEHSLSNLLKTYKKNISIVSFTPSPLIPLIINDNEVPRLQATLMNTNVSTNLNEEILQNKTANDVLNNTTNDDETEITIATALEHENSAYSFEVINEPKLNTIITTIEDSLGSANIELGETNIAIEDGILSNLNAFSVNVEEEPLNLNNAISIHNVYNESSDNSIIISKPTSSIKSNIPKPIKPSNKSKADKVAPKLIVSKVPIRRNSIKQYAAPQPPKTSFKNVHIGNVKQLQSRLFNNASTPRTIPTKSIKQKAPEPPNSEHLATPTPKIESKKTYFRETCRSDDDWTESEAETNDINQRKHEKLESPNTKEELRPPSPIFSHTVRRVSGQLIDLNDVRLLEGSPERQARMLLAEGKTETWEQARLAVELVSRGTEPPVALLAALDCADLAAALVYLHQECELCTSRLAEHEMVSMLSCTHRCCRECARLYFTVQITERNIVDCVCPYCKEPEIEILNDDAESEYFAHLDILLKTLLTGDVHELFQRKLRDRTLARDPNFRWCVECSSGFFVHPKQKRHRCPECRTVTCASCRKPWTSQHENLSCEAYGTWLEDNDPERSVIAVQQHLRENGLECPRCHFKYSLSRGGCMHFTCTQCKYEFCYGCGKPFMMGARCGLSEYCAKLGLHAHHPRNCLFYLRDKEPHELQTLLQMNHVTFEVEETDANASGNRCPIQLQRETPTGLVDGTCGGDVVPRHAGLCKNHYLEYLSRVIRSHGVDPLPILSVDDLETLVRRAALRPPPRPYGSLEGLYKRNLLEIVKDKIPLE